MLFCCGLTSYGTYCARCEEVEKVKRKKSANQPTIKISNINNQRILIVGWSVIARRRLSIGERVVASTREKYKPVFSPDPPKNVTSFYSKHFCEAISKLAALPYFQAISSPLMVKFYLAASYCRFEDLVTAHFSHSII